MNRQRKPAQTADYNLPKPVPSHYPHLIWFIWLLQSLVILPLCLDWQLVPRFFTLALFIAIFLVFLWKDLYENADWRFSILDIALSGWCLLNFAGIFWAFSWSEAVFFAQKTGLFFCVYWFVRQALFRNETGVLQALWQATLILTFIVVLVTVYEIYPVTMKQGFDNQQLYNHVKLLYGNKNLTADFLFFLLIFNGLCIQLPAQKYVKSNWIKWLTIGLMALLGLLIVVLQTRTVYLALSGAGVLWMALSAFHPGHIVRQKKAWLLPLALITAGTLYYVSHTDGSLAERLNPLTYLDSDTANERRFVWYKTDLLNQEHYWWGVGNGSWKFRWPEKSLQGGYRMEQLQVAFTRAHNDYLEIRAELGIIGAVWFCGLFVLAAIAGLYTWKKNIETKHFNPALPVVLAGIFGYCIIQYFDFPRERMEMQVVLALLLALSAHFSHTFWQKLPGFYASSRKKSIFLLFLALNAIGGLIIGGYRMNGEMHNVRLLQAAEKKDNMTVIRETRAAMNPFYEYDDVGQALPWYEGGAYEQMQQLDKSLAAFKRAAELNPWNYQTLNNYATLIVKTAQAGDTAALKTAVGVFESAVHINPRRHDAKFNLVYTLIQLGDRKAALSWIEKVDTLRQPADKEDRAYNEFIRQKQAEFRRAIESK